MRGSARPRRATAPHHGRQGPGCVPGVLARREAGRVRGAGHRSLGRRQPRVRRARRREHASRAHLARAAPPIALFPGRARLGPLDRRPKSCSCSSATRCDHPAPGAGRRAGSREVVGGDLQIDGVAARAGRRGSRSRRVARSAERAVPEHARGRRARPADQLNRDIVAEMARRGQADRRSRVPTAPRSSTSCCSLPAAAAGVAAARRNPRRPPRGVAVRAVAGAASGARRCRLRRRPAEPAWSTSYGQAFTSACVGDWGGGDARTSSRAATT